MWGQGDVLLNEDKVAENTEEARPKKVRKMLPWKYGGKEQVKRKVEEIAAGKITKVQAAKDLGYSLSGMHKAMKSKEIREHLLRVANENVIHIVPKAMDNVRKGVEMLNDGEELSEKQIDLGWKATETSLRMGGLLASGGESYHLTQIYHDQKVLISPAIQTLLDEHAKKFTFSQDELRLIQDATGTYCQEPDQATEGKDSEGQESESV